MAWRHQVAGLLVLLLLPATAWTEQGSQTPGEAESKPAADREEGEASPSPSTQPGGAGEEGREDASGDPAGEGAEGEELEALRRAAEAQLGMTETPADQPLGEEELAELRRLASEAGEDLVDEEASLPSVLSAATDSLNRLNPEISVTADLLGALVPQSPWVLGETRSGFSLRHLELDLRASLDPFSSFRAQIAAGAHGFEIEEMFLRWTGPWQGMSLTAGRFKQALGTLNRWHAHAWDQHDLPLALRGTVGGHGLLQTGLRAEYLIPGLEVLPTSLNLELTNSENEALLAGEFFALPSVLGRVGSELPLAGLGYLELGISWLHGYHHQIVADAAAHDHGEEEPEAAHADEHGEEAIEIVVEDARATDLASLDLNLAYDPPGGADRFRAYLRGQLIYLRRDEGEHGVAQQLGGFAYLNAHLGRSWELGLRGDWLSGRDAELDHALEHARVGLSPYLSWWQSEFVRARLQYRIEADAAGFDHPQHLVLLQLTGAVGPHRHERY